MLVYFATDHAGFELKNVLLEYVKGLGHEVEDCGAFEYDEVDDYPELIAKAAQKVSEKPDECKAIVLGGSGQGEAMVANRFSGVRAAVYYGMVENRKQKTENSDDQIIRLSREHNDANILSLGARFLTETQAKEAVKLWLETPFAGDERHARRIKQIDGNSH